MKGIKMEMEVYVSLFDAVGASEDDRILVAKSACRFIERFGIEKAHALYVDFVEKLDEGDTTTENGEHAWCDLEAEVVQCATRAMNKKHFERRAALSSWFGEAAHLEFQFFK